MGRVAPGGRRATGVVGVVAGGGAGGGGDRGGRCVAVDAVLYEEAAGTVHEHPRLLCGRSRPHDRAARSAARRHAGNEWDGGWRWGGVGLRWGRGV